jgi:hypothetical protein
MNSSITRPDGSGVQCTIRVVPDAVIGEVDFTVYIQVVFGAMSCVDT